MENTPVLIYVVDDESETGELIGTLLNREGFRTQVFSDPTLTLKSLRDSTEKPALMITDYTMNSINGMDLIARCNRIQPKLRTILFSGTFGGDIYNHYGIQPDTFLEKPIETKALLSAVRSVLEKSKESTDPLPPPTLSAQRS